MPWYVFALEGLQPLFNTTYEVTGAIILVIGIAAYLTRPRRIYFVRHGETAANAERIRQGAEGGLSARGRDQAQAAGEYLAAFPISAMVSSPYPRAAETAAIINERLRVPLSYSSLLVERRNPTEVVGKSEDDQTIEHIMDRIDRIYHEDAYRYSDEENFVDLKERAKKCLDLFASQSARHTVAVTHSIFLKMIIAYLLYRDLIHAGDYVKLSFYNASDNAGITICEYHPLWRFGKTRGWSIIEYNVTPFDSLATVYKIPRIPTLVS